MLNRRLIRIRAMQALYAYETAQKANFELAKDLIAENFSPDLNSMEKQDKAKLQEMAKLGQKKLTEMASIPSVAVPTEVPEEVGRVVAKAHDFLKTKNRKDFDYYSQRTIVEAENVYSVYIMFLQLFIELAKKSETDARHDKPSRLANNKILKLLDHDKTFENQRLRRGFDWENEATFVTKLYKEAIRENTRYLEYCEAQNHTLEDDLAVLKYLLKNIVLKHELAFEFFEKRDIYWTESMETLRSMASQTFQRIADGDEETVETLGETWSEARDFLNTLFRKTIQEERELTEKMLPKLQNWELERISETDKILIKMGLVELINFPSIPVKVTINELIEIAKNYSTEKSGVFINGVLDALSKDLLKTGEIQKSGRGMLDNR